LEAVMESKDWIIAAAREIASHWTGGRGLDGYLTDEQKHNIANNFAAMIEKHYPDPPIQMVDGIVRPVPWPGEPPLLQCIDCHNTESPAGAMARYFNRGRCVHCGGYFKVIRA
jgi:hypothetical protein